MALGKQYGKIRLGNTVVLYRYSRALEFYFLIFIFHFAECSRRLYRKSTGLTHTHYNIIYYHIFYSGTRGCYYFFYYFFQPIVKGPSVFKSENIARCNQRDNMCRYD